MKILVASSTFPTGELDGSRPRFVFDLAEALCAHADVMVLAPHHPGAAVRERMGAVDVLRFRYWWPTTTARLTPNMRQQVRGSILATVQVPFFLLAEIWSLWRTVNRHDIDVVNAHWMVPQGLSAAVVRGLRKPRFLHALHVHAGDVYFLARLPFGRTIARFIMARTDRVFADGSHVRDTLHSLLGYDSGARIQPMGVHSAFFRDPEEIEVPRMDDFPEGAILFIGRFVEKKGVVYLIRALPRILKEHPGIGLLLIGDGPDAGLLRAEVHSFNLEDRVRFLGHRPHAEAIVHLRRCRVAAVPSIVDSHGETEGMPTVVVEAMAAGVRVVGSAVDGIPDLIRHGENGWLCAEKDPEDLAAKLLLALSDGPGSGIVEAAEETGRRYEWPQVARNYMDALRA